MQPNDFWERDEYHQDQRFYVTFCILFSACSDYAVGVTLERQKKLNWACTALYYSLVHAVRLICFVDTADFPTGHRDLATLLAEGHLERRGVDTWTKRKLKDFVQSYERLQVQPVTSFSLGGHSGIDAGYWGEILNEARLLRDAANYEGLLIAHEHSHRVVTLSFTTLAKALRRACEGLIPCCVELFKSFVDTHQRKDSWYAYLNWDGEGLEYLRASLQHKRCYKAVIGTVLKWLGGLEESDLDESLALEVYRNIEMGTFGPKTMLMTDFRSRIRHFERLLDRGGIVSATARGSGLY